jgi:hypothetical protein
MAQDGYVAGPFEADPGALVDRARQTLAERFPNVVLPPGSLLAWDVETDAQTAADIGVLALTVAEDVTIDVLSRLLSEPRRQASPARSTATLQVTGETAVTVPVGTILEGTGPGGEPVSVETTGIATAAIDQLEIASVPVQTLQTGEAANGGSGDLLGMDQWPWGISAELDAPLEGATDEEDRGTYLGRLVRLARLISPRPITPEDIAEYAVLKVQGVAAAVALENTIPGPPVQTGVAGHFTVGIRSGDGTAPPGSVVTATQAAYDAALTSTIHAHVRTGDYTTVNVALTVYAWAGYDHDTVAASVVQQITGYLAPNRWGEPPSVGDIGGDNDPRWEYADTVHRAEIVARADDGTGVDRVDLDSVLINGVDADLALTGLMPLTLPGTITVTVLDR